jgi:hypothetical protein
MEIEIKIERPAVDKGVCVGCGEESKLILLIGQIQHIGGTEYETCGSRACEETALDIALENLRDMKENPKQYQYELTEGE